ncbi:hypothetical protein AVEN_272077-1 [Araneus ventricosus]|uniref:Uncharacterized protein n=1 Tax=Araneus ventricosus TaxID=182803 RepID=A0A4Y2WHZ0_ARAVE|nr:hypothetical protein AVEN_272077-1 [Araneus ventricosus]
MNENLNDEHFRSPLPIEVLKWTEFSVKGKIINQEYILCGLNPVQPQYKKHFEKIKRQKMLNENSKDTRACKIIYPLCRNYDEDKRRQTYKDKRSTKFWKLANLVPSMKKHSN